MMNPDRIILQAITGSTAYGIANELSDIDRHGIFLATNKELLGIFQVEESIVTVQPDVTFHELGKFVRLAMKCNPTILELLFMENYEVVHHAGRLLIDNRDMFLSNLAFKAYGGYAIDQARSLKARGDTFSSSMRNRTAKHARHCLRLLQQGSQLLKTKVIDVRVENAREILDFGQLPVENILERFEAEFARFEAVQSILPEAPDTDRINRVLLEIRDCYG